MPLPPGYQWKTQFNPVEHPELHVPTREEFQQDKQDYANKEDAFSQWDWQNKDGVGPDGQALPLYASGWQPNGQADFGGGLLGWGRKFTSAVQTASDKGYTEGLRISKAEQLQAGIQGTTDEVKAEHASKAGIVTAAAEATKEVFNQALWGVLEALAVPAKVAEKSIGAIGRTVGKEITGEAQPNVLQELKRNYDASELAYSAVFDMTIYAEMERRIDAGVRPDLAAQEIQIAKPNTMWTELIGQGIIDPLNYLTLIGKAGEQIRVTKAAEAGFLAVENKGIAKLLEDVSKMDETQAYSHVQEALKTQQGLLVAASHAEDIKNSEKGLITLSKDYAMRSLTADGKIAHLANETYDVTMHIVTASSKEEPIEIFRAMVKSTNADPVIAAEGLATMAHFEDAPALFSQAANKTTVLLSRVTEKYGKDWLKDIELLKDNKPELIKALLGKLDDVGQEMFPSVVDMLKAEDEVKAAKEGVVLSERTKALADRARALPDHVKAATRFHENAQKVVGPINKFFVGAYMGWSPGFASRNYLNNTLQILIDHGAGALLNVDNKLAAAERIHGGLLQGVYSEGGAAASLIKAEKMSGRGTGIASALEAAKAKGISGPVLGISQTAEAHAAAGVIGKTYMDTFERGVKAMTRALEPDLKAAGFSDDIIKRLPTYIMQNDGDAKRIITALRNDIKAGMIDMFNDISRIDPKYKSFLSGVNKWDEYSSKVLQAASPEEAKLAAKKIFDDLAQVSDDVYQEGRAAVDDYDKFLKMAEEKSGLPTTSGELIGIRKTESRNAIRAAEAILAQADNAGAAMGLKVGDLKNAHGITGLNTWGDSAAKEADRINGLAWKLTNDAKQGKTDLKALWLGHPELFPGTPPAGLDRQVFLDSLWAQYDPVVSKIWGGARDAAMEGVSGYLDDLKKLGVPVKPEWYDTIKVAQEGAQRWDTAVIGMNGEKWVEKTAVGTHPTKIAELANRYGIPTAKAGVPQDKKILNIINKYGNTNFKSLDEPISLQLVEDAFVKKTGQIPDVVKTTLATSKSPAVANAEKAFLSGNVTPELKAQHPFLNAAFDDAVTKYPSNNPLFPEIEKAKNLLPEQRIVESRFAEKISSDIDGAIAEYWKARTGSNGNVLNVDYARELSPDYLADPLNNAAAVQKPASALIRNIWNKEMATPPNGLLETITFTAGGGGSGKGTALENVYLPKSKLVWDMTLSETKDLKYIDEAVKSGRQVELIHIARDPMDALLGIVERAKTERRVVPLEVWADAHSGAPETFRQAVSKYQGDLNVNLHVVDNTGSFGNATEVGLDFMDKRVYSKEELLQQGRDILQKEYKNGNISEEIYRAIIGDGQKSTERLSGNASKRGSQELSQGGIQGGVNTERATYGGQPQQQRTINEIDNTKAYYDDAGKLVEPTRPAERLKPPSVDGEIPPLSRVVHEQMDEVKKMREWIMKDIDQNFGKKQLVDKGANRALQLAERELTQKLAQNKLISSRVAQANRDFTLLNYGDKSYFDVALAYLYPFHFWYKGNYGNWIRRIAQNPSVLANYSRYKKELATIHAGMEEWWKYNINTNDLPGIEVDHPLYLNLEATLWPLNGITGVDYIDNSKNVDWWTKSLDFMGKFGPSVWTPLTIATGLALHAKGEAEAGDKWMGRLFPQSATIKAGASLLGVANLETDPLVKLFQGNLDPQERRRAQRALANIMQDAEDGNSPYTKEQILDAAYKQEGQIWEEAVKRAVRGRAPSQVASFLFGVGFKGRTEQDMEIDNFYQDYNKLWTMSPNVSAQEFSQGMESLKTKYPFMDTVLLSRRDGTERDAGLAYNILGRIPPGKSSDYAKAAGIEPALFEKFSNDKGQIENWDKADYMALMQGVLKLSAVLEIPPDMTRKEWVAAKNTYKTAMEEAKAQFGDGIWDTVDGYYQAKTVSYDAADAYLQKHPEVQQALDWKAKRIMDSPLLSSYYGGANVIESYYRSQMYADIETKLGKEVFDTVQQYNDLKTYGTPGVIKEFYNQHKAEIKQYYTLKDTWQTTIDQKVAQMGAEIPEGADARIREDIPGSSVGATNLAQNLQEQSPPTYQDFQAMIPSHILNIVQDYILRGDKMQESATKQLERLARDMGYAGAHDLIQAIGVSLYQGQP